MMTFSNFLFPAFTEPERIFEECFDRCKRSIDPIISSRKLRRMTRQQPTRPTEWKTEKHRFAVRSSLRSNDAPELISLPLFLRPIMLSSLSLKPQNKMSPSGMAAWQGPPALRLIPRRGGKKNHQKGQRGECGARGRLQ